MVFIFLWNCPKLSPGHLRVVKKTDQFNFRQTRVAYPVKLFRSILRNVREEAFFVDMHKKITGFKTLLLPFFNALSPVGDALHISGVITNAGESDKGFWDG